MSPQGFVEVTVEDVHYPLKFHRSQFSARAADSHVPAPGGMVYFWNKAELATAERDTTWDR